MSVRSFVFGILTVLFVSPLLAQNDPFTVGTPLTAQGVFSCGDLTVSSGTIDSSGVTNTAITQRAIIRSNGNVKVSGGTVNGDVIAGPGKLVTLSGSGKVTGTTSSAATAANCIPIDLTALAPTVQGTNNNANIPLTAQGKNPLGGSSHTEFTLSGGDGITLPSGTYYFTKISISGGSTITLNGTVKILCAGRVDISGGSIVNTNASPFALRLWVSGSPFTLSSSTLSGIVYAPTASATVSSGTLKGSLFANTVTVSGSSHLTQINDDANPRVTITSPADGALITSPSVTVTGTASDSETSVTLSVNGQSVTVAADGTFQTTVNLRGQASPKITAIATDAVGNMSTTSITLSAPTPTVTSITPTKGPVSGGTSITVLGTNFTDSTDTTLTIGGISATQVAVLSPNKLTAVTPALPSGTVSVVVTTFAGASTLQNGFTYLAAPSITSFAPGSGGSGTTVTIAGQNFDPDPNGDHVFLGTLVAPIVSATSTQLVVTVPTGAQTGRLTVTTAGGTATSATDFTVATFSALQITAPTTTLDVGQRVQFNAIGLFPTGGGADVTAKASWSSSGAVTVDVNGMVTAAQPGSGDVFASLNGFSASIRVSATTIVLPPDPASIAPALNPTQVTPMVDGTAFLYQGTNPIQTGVGPNVITRDRAAVLRGRVLTRDGASLPGIRIAIASHPEYGQTLSRDDGRFDLAVNGGSWLTVRYERPGYIPTDRTVNVPWADYVSVEDVALVSLDGAVTPIASGATRMQVARGTTSSDKDGSRTATVLFPAGTTASMTFPNGTTQPLATLNVRATEFTVGTAGPLAMPADLPPTSKYTYCVELSVDEAVRGGASSVTFSKTLPLYLDNFLNLPVGTIVPVGYYDRAARRWVASDNGRVIKILAITNGTATVDTNGDGVADDATTLAAIGIDADELQQLGTLYTIGKTLWRAPINHFTSWDCNFFAWAGPPEGAEAPSGGPTRNNRVKKCEKCEGSIIGVQDQTLGEELPLVGTGLTLSYNSSEQRGRLDQYQINIPITGANPPSGVTYAHLKVSVAGTTFQQEFSAAPNQTYTYTWSGKDAYGRLVQGTQDAHVDIGYEYLAGAYTAPDAKGKAFGKYPNNPISLCPERLSIIIWTRFDIPIGSIDAKDANGLGGWNLSGHHIYDPLGRTLHLGGGDTIDSAQLGKTLVRVAGNGSCCIAVDGAGARETALNYSNSISVAPDGGFYITQSDTILKVQKDGTIARIGGIYGNKGFSPDGTIALNAKLNPWAGAIGPDGFYFIDAGTRVRKITSDGAIITVAGNGQKNAAVKEGPALSTPIVCEAIAIDHDGNVYIASDSTIERVTPDGDLTIIAGGGGFGKIKDGQPARIAPLVNAISIAVGPNGRLYIGDNFQHFIGEIAGDGLLRVVAGLGANPDTDGVPARSIHIDSSIWGMDVGTDGTIYFTTLETQTVRAIRPDGIIVRLAGGVREDFKVIPYPDNAPAIGTPVFYPWGVAAAPDGSVLFSAYDENTIRRILPTYPGASATETVVASENGGLAYVFDASGRHSRTVDTTMGIVLSTFSCDGAGRLQSIADVDGNQVTIDRATDGTPKAIVAPGGQRTTLAIDANGYLSSVTSPAGEATKLTHTSRGLLTDLVTPGGHEYSFTHDANGRLQLDADPADGSTALARTGTDDDLIVTRTTAEGRTSVYETIRPVNGGEIRRNTSADGLMTTSSEGADRSLTVSGPDGTTMNVRMVPDSRFGMMASLPSVGSLTIGSHNAAAQYSRAVTLSQPGNPFAVATLRETLAVNGKPWSTLYDRAASSLTTTSPLGRSSVASIDPSGRIANIRVAALAPFTMSYTTWGALESVAQGTRITNMTYDGAHRLQSLTDPLRRTITFTYDAADRVTGETLPGGRTIAFTYDHDGNLTSVAPPSRPAHTFHYTPVNLADLYTPPTVTNGGTTTYAYNKDRQLTLITRPDSEAIGLGYDSAGRLASLVWPSAALTYGYDGKGRLSSINNSNGASMTYSYDGPLLKSQTWTGEVSGAIGYTYDNDLRVASENGVTLGYDDDGLLVKAGALTLNRDSQTGLVTGTSLGNVSDEWTYDEFSEPMTYSVSLNAAEALREVYTRDDIGRIAQVVETTGGHSTTTAYTYDEAGHMATVTRDGLQTASYTYDANGNRVGGTYDDQDRLLSMNGVTYTYTTNGELAAKTDASGTTSFTYDALGNLRTVLMPDGKRVDYVIDAKNRRVGKKVGGTLVNGWLYGDQLRIVAETDGAGAVTKQFIYGARSNAPSVMIANGITYRIVTDHLGSPRYVIESSTGTPVEVITYDEFGNITSDSNPGMQPFGFAGGLYDRDTGLTRFGARDYDPQLGRWTAKDPLGLAAGELDLYTYSNNDPVNFIDPSGLEHVNEPGFTKPMTAPGPPITTLIPSADDVDSIARHINRGSVSLPGWVIAAISRDYDLGPCDTIFVKSPAFGSWNITFGNVIVLTPKSFHDTAIRNHELVHVSQYETQGFEFFIDYASDSLANGVLNGEWHDLNHHEIEAERKAGKQGPTCGCK